MSLSTQSFLPLTTTVADQSASRRAWDFYAGWFLDPMVYGDYPNCMKLSVGERLPKFTKEEQKMVKGSYDFVGVNYYTSRYVQAKKLSSTNESASYENDQHLQQLTEKNGVPIGEQAEGFDQIYVYPAGLGAVLQYVKHAYNNPKIFITENGYPDKRNDSIPIKQALQDDKRIMVLQQHLYRVRGAIRKGVNIKGYFVWSLIDNMEPNSYYSIRYGLCYVDYNDNYKRYPKKSVSWYRKLITG
ncbi:Beta-glucosidase [Bertholletia excelsa]